MKKKINNPQFCKRCGGSGQVRPDNDYVPPGTVEGIPVVTPDGDYYWPCPTCKGTGKR